MPAHAVAVAIKPKLGAPCSARSNWKPRSSVPGAGLVRDHRGTQGTACKCVAGSLELPQPAARPGAERGRVELVIVTAGTNPKAAHTILAILPAVCVLLGPPTLPPVDWAPYPAISPAQAASEPLESLTLNSSLETATGQPRLGHDLPASIRTAPVLSDLADASPAARARPGLRLDGGGAAGAGGSLLEGELPTSRPALPKQYVKDAKDLIAALKATITKEAEGASEFETRRSADSAKELVKKFVSEWPRNQLVANDETCINITAAIRELGKFYSANGPRAALTSETRTLILGLLDNASKLL